MTWIGKTVFPEFTTESQTVPERPDWKTRDGEAEVGDGVQGLPGVSGRLHEHAGIVTCAADHPICPVLELN